MTNNSIEGCSQLWGKKKTLSDFVQFCLKILYQGGFSHSPWETLLKARPSEFHTTCSLWFIHITLSWFKSCHRSPWDGHWLLSFTSPVVNPVEPPNCSIKVQCLPRWMYPKRFPQSLCQWIGWLFSSAPQSLLFVSLWSSLPGLLGFPLSSFWKESWCLG